MNRNQLRLSAVGLTVLMVIVGAKGLDHLPGEVRTGIGTERTAMAAAQTQLTGLRSQIAGEVQTEPELFQALKFGREWPDRFNRAEIELRAAARDLDDLNKLEKSDHRSDRQQAEKLLASEKQSRTQALADASAVQADAAKWLDARKNLPRQLAAMERNYQALHNLDLSAASAAVTKAEGDWPEKKTDLESRLSSARELIAQTDAQWQGSGEARRKAASGAATGAEAASLLTLGERLQGTADGVSKKVAEIQTLTGQLYLSWDKLLVDMQTKGSDYQQKIRTVRTQLANAAAKTGQVSSDEQWTTVPRARYEAMKSDLGMAVEHKAAGKYDFEAEHVSQPAGMAYVAPPSQGSNQYGYWDHRGGSDFWVFYGQYALMRDLLFNRSYRPFERYEYDEYRDYRTRNQTYYGHDAATNNAPKYGSAGTATQQGYSSSSYAKSGGFRESKYAAKSGNYRDSQYATPAARNPGGDNSPKVFGKQSPQSQPRAAPAPRTYRPAAPRSAPRSFGRRR